MKKLSFLFVALALLVFVACKDKEKEAKGSPNPDKDSLEIVDSGTPGTVATETDDMMTDDVDEGDMIDDAAMKDTPEE